MRHLDMFLRAEVDGGDGLIEGVDTVSVGSGGGNVIEVVPLVDCF